MTTISISSFVTLDLPVADARVWSPFQLIVPVSFLLAVCVWSVSTFKLPIVAHSAVAVEQSENKIILHRTRQ